MKTKVIIIAILSLFFINIHHSMAQNKEQSMKEEKNHNDKLVVVWTSGDADVAKKMVYMYTYNAKKNGWWKEITFIIWGPSSKLLAEDTELQDYLAKMKDEGIVLEACKACADMYDVSDKLIDLGVDVKYMGTALTDYIKGNEHVITF